MKRPARNARVALAALVSVVTVAGLIATAWPQSVPLPPNIMPYLGGMVTFESTGGIDIRAMMTRPRVPRRAQKGDRATGRAKLDKVRYPAFIFTHDRMPKELAERPVPLTRPDPGSYLDQLATDGYVVMFVVRRGHWGSKGTTRSYAPGKGETPLSPAELYDQLEAESADLIAAVDYLHGLPFVDKDRIAMGGVGAGGLAALLAAAKDPRVRAVVSLAGGLQFPPEAKDAAKPLNDRAWTDVAKTLRAPLLILWAKNDPLDPAVGQDLEQRVKSAGGRVQLIVYPEFEDNGRRMFFKGTAFKIFTPDLVAFLNATIGPPPLPPEEAGPRAPAPK